MGITIDSTLMAPHARRAVVAATIARHTTLIHGCVYAATISLILLFVAMIG
jgi:hypothetical protein